MAKKITFTAATLNGTVATRTSDCRTYTHCIVNSSTVLTWCGSLALAQKQLRSYQGTRAAANGVTFAIAEVTTG
jgi:hypothetical protein